MKWNQNARNLIIESAKESVQQALFAWKKIDESVNLLAF
jgi:hypothetical protein